MSRGFPTTLGHSQFFPGSGSLVLEHFPTLAGAAPAAADHVHAAAEVWGGGPGQATKSWSMGISGS